MKKSWKKRLCCGLMALCVACVTPLSASAETVAEIQAEQNRLQAEKEDLQSQLDDLRNQEAEKQAYQDTLQEQIQVVQEQIDTTRQNIDDLNQSITELTMKLDASQAEIQDTIDEFKERLVALYTAGNISTLEILLDSNSLSEFTTRSEMIENMTAHDQDLVDKLEAYVESTSAEREERQAQMDEVAELKKSLENQQDEAGRPLRGERRCLEEIQGAEGATENALAANEEELAAYEQKMQEAIAAQKAAEEAAKEAAGSNGSSGSSGSSSSGSGGSSSGGSTGYPTTGGGVEGFDPIWPCRRDLHLRRLQRLPRPQRPGYRGPLRHAHCGRGGRHRHRGQQHGLLGHVLGLLCADLPQRHLHHPLCPHEFRSGVHRPVCDGRHGHRL